jgi:serine/threonine-protein kinase
MAVELGEKALALSNDAGHFKGSLGLNYGRAGMHDRARAVLDDLQGLENSQYVSPLWLAWIHLGLGEEDRALDLLAEAATQRAPWLFQIHQDPNYSPLWADPRFTEFASKVGSGVESSGWDRLDAPGGSHIGATRGG